MGNFLTSTVPSQEPLLFSYYGPIQQQEASEAINLAIASLLHDSDSKPRIPIRTETVRNLIIPIGLHDTPFSLVNDTTFRVFFSTTISGRCFFTSKETEQASYFESNLDNSLDFSFLSDGEGFLKFSFDVKEGVSDRIYRLVFHPHSIPVVSHDQIVLDGMLCSVSKIYGREQDDKSLCLICWSMPCSVVSLPCRHCLMCKKCAEQYVLKSSYCPLCRCLVHELIEMNSFD